MNNETIVNAYISVSFLYNGQTLWLNFFHDLSMKGKLLDKFDAELLVSYVLSQNNVPSKEVYVKNVNICREINKIWHQIFYAETLTFYHRGKQ